jgi:hypothetical protein
VAFGGEEGRFGLISGFQQDRIITLGHDDASPRRSAACFDWLPGHPAERRPGFAKLGHGLNGADATTQNQERHRRDRGHDERAQEQV